MFLAQRIKKAYMNVYNTRMYRKWRYKIVWRKVLIKCNFKIYMKRNRGLYNIHKQLIRSSMTYGGIGFRDSIKFRAKELLVTALEQSERIKYLKIAVRKFKKCINCHQRNLRIKVTFREIMLNVMIDYWYRVIETMRIESKENECEHVYKICKELENVQWDVMKAVLKEYVTIALRWCSISFLKKRILMIPEIEEEFP